MGSDVSIKIFLGFLNNATSRLILPGFSRVPKSISIKVSWVDLGVLLKNIRWGRKIIGCCRFF